MKKNKLFFKKKIFKKIKNIDFAILRIFSSSNNTIITVLGKFGNVLY